MEKRRHVALIGFMAAGKTTVGKRLAARLGRPFYDTDAQIVQRCGPIARIFETEGEPAFRAYEREAVELALKTETPSVVAVGGGAPTYPPTRRLLECHAYRVFLEVEAERIVERVRRKGALRPLLGAAPSRKTISELLRARTPLYREAELIVACTGMSREAILDAICEHLRAVGATP